MQHKDGLDLMLDIADGDATMDSWRKMMDPVQDLVPIDQTATQAAYRVCFGTPAGQEVLRDLYARHVNVTRAVPGQGSDFAFYREGMAQLVMEIVDLINQADPEKES